MSTGLNCELIQVTEKNQHDKWYYILEDWDSPKGAFDWYDYATAYGHFDSHEATIKHLRDHHANPGGYSVSTMTIDELHQNKGLFKLIQALAQRRLVESAQRRGLVRRRW